MNAPGPEHLRPLLAWASDHFAFPLPAAYPFPLAKYALVRERLLADGADDDQVLAALEDTIEAHVNVWRAARVARERRPAVTKHSTTARGAHS